jgi:O-antigen ligase
MDGNYLGYSLVMWVIYGLPVHWVIQKYGNGALIYYILAAIIWIVFQSYDQTSLKNVINTIMIGMPAIIQAVVFKFYFDSESIQYASEQRTNKKT